MTERSDVWITYDDQNIYVTCRCWDSAPPDQWIANELRRDTNGLRQNDHFGVMFDTFYDRRSGFAFYTNPLGAPRRLLGRRRGRLEHRLESRLDIEDRPVRRRLDRRDGDPVQVDSLPSGQRSGVGHPAATLRATKNEWAYLTPVPQNLAGPQAFNRISAGRHARRSRSSAGRQEYRAQAVRVSRMTTDRLRTPRLRTTSPATSAAT